MPRIMKRKTAMSARKRFIRKPRTKPKRRFAGKAGIVRVVNKLLNKKLETRMSTRVAPGSNGVQHNNFIQLESAADMFKTVNGTLDPMTGDGYRIGDDINLKGVSFKMMMELDIRYSDVTLRFMLIKSAKGDVPTRATLYAGVCGNKMIDKINKERYTILAQKYVKLKASNTGTYGPEVGSVVPPVANYGFNRAQDADIIQSRTTKIVTMYIPGRKFTRDGVLHYENQSANQIKFFDYTLVCYAYANVSTNQDIVTVCYVNDYVKQFYYTDA